MNSWSLRLRIARLVLYMVNDLIGLVACLSAGYLSIRHFDDPAYVVPRFLVCVAIWMLASGPKGSHS